MAYCVKCGAQVGEDVKFCPQCGEKIPHIQGNTGTADSTFDGAQSYTYYQENDSAQQTYEGQQYGEVYCSEVSDEYFNRDEVKKNKGMGVLSYLGILVLIPLLAGDKRSEYVRHHANQGLILFLISAIIDLLDGEWIWGLHSWINFGGSWFSWIFDIVGFACFILWIMGIVSACKGTRKELPIIGKIKFLK